MTQTPATTAPATPTGTLLGSGIWAPDGAALAGFYAAALGWESRHTFHDEDGNPAAHLISDGVRTLVFCTARTFRAPEWPREELPFHLDLAFEDPAAAEERLLALGATRPDHQPGEGRWTVLLDPSGQPFCVCRAS